MQSVHVYNLNKIMTPIVIKKGKLFQNLFRLNIMFVYFFYDNCKYNCFETHCPTFLGPPLI